ncbi:hypothetical protein C8R48DRAFT_776233 [Suillus tomentosus]|nr:hypothetical protein C8R48DRAFT_776233 [Suillus tomentosus]
MKLKSGKLSLANRRQDPIASSPHLPTEILFRILILQPLVTQWTCPNACREMMNILLRCCRVSKAWCEVAREILYRCIPLTQAKSLRLLLRTVFSERFDGICPARALHFSPRFSTPRPDEMQLREFAELAGTIVLPALHQHKASPQILTGLRVSRQDLQLLAPLLVQLSNLEFFEMHQSHGDGDALGHSFSPPTFQLSSISISQTELSPSLCKWLFSSSSQTIESLEVQEVGASLRHLIEVIGDFVKKLHIKQMFDMIVRSDLDAIKALSGLPRLQSLRIDGRCFKIEPLLNLQSSLETFAFSNAVARNVQARLESGWQPSLRSLDMYCGPGLLTLLPWIPTTTEQKEVRELAMACAVRGIKLNTMFIF